MKEELLAYHRREMERAAKQADEWVKSPVYAWLTEEDVMGHVAYWKERSEFHRRAVEWLNLSMGPFSEEGQQMPLPEPPKQP